MERMNSVRCSFGLQGHMPRRGLSLSLYQRHARADPRYLCKDGPRLLQELPKTCARVFQADAVVCRADGLGKKAKQY